MSWFWRGFQSAIFYYVSCAPCTKIAYRHRRRKNARRARAERQAMEEAGQMYPHPSPFSTNMYWGEEIALGPGPPRRKKDSERRGNEKGEARGLVSAGVGSSSGTGVSGSSADTVMGGMTMVEQEIRRSSEGWNRRRYQREDELLWGIDSSDDEEVQEGDRYYIARNPGINDLHPPVVSTQPTHRSEMRWMLQPPPSAKIMEGKERANRSRSGSGGSSRRGVEVALGKQIGDRMMEEKRRRNQGLEQSPSITRASTRGSNISNRGQQHDRDTDRISTISKTSTASGDSKKRKPTAPPPIHIPIATSSTTHPPQVASTNQTSPSLLAPHRPPLQTIPSSTLQTPNLAIRQAQLSPGKPQLLTASSTSSLRVLQELVSPSSALNIRPLPSPSLQIRLPPPEKGEDRELEVPVVESYFPLRSEFMFPPPQLAGKEAALTGSGTRQKVETEVGTGRWSMDI
ncbi:MAG: hypothetical protein Q9190_003303 [Brigantiaea leucoxantha]